MALRVLLAGRIALDADGNLVEADGVGRLGRLAFAYLVTERRRPVPHDELAEVLWAEHLPRSWPTSLRVLVSKLRSFLVRGGLDREALTTEHGCLRLTLPVGAVVDIEEAAEALAEAEEALPGGAERARKLAGESLAVASRHFLPGGTGAWAERRQGELRDLHVRALEVLAAACGGCGDGSAAVGAAEAAVALEPFRESAWLLLIEAHAAAGNRAEALRAYARCRHQLVEELGVGPSVKTEAAYAALLADEAVGGAGPAGAAGVGAGPAALPRPVTSFVGRENDLAELDRLLASSRLVTLVGPGGVGKSRLALEMAARAAPEMVGGVALVELGRLADPSLVDLEVLAALGLAEMPGATAAETVIAHLRENPMLLVLDNCEHVLDAAAALVDRVLRRCPDVWILATSRERLAMAGEAAWPVRALTVPADELGSSAEDLLGYESVQLLVDRAQSVHPGFELDETNAGAAVQICRGLDGMPLALELAAARVGALSLSDIAARLADRFTLLAGGDRTALPHHRTLRATVEWSYDALSVEERAVFERTAVFSGGFTLDAAEQVCADQLIAESSVAQHVARLVETSLIIRDERASACRYVLPETVRQFGRERLEHAGAPDFVRAGHLQWATRLAQRAERNLLQGGDQAQWLDVFEREQDNFRAALGWTGAGPEGLALAVALGRFWELRGHLTEGRRWLQGVLAGPGGAGDPGSPAESSVLVAGALNSAGVLAQRQGDYAAAHDYYQRSLAIVRDLGDRLGMATALHGLGNLAALQGDPTARVFFEESLAIGRELDAPHVVAASLTNLGSVAQNQGDLGAARELAAESLALRRRLGDQHGVAMVLGNLGYLAYQQGDFVAAKELDDESLALRRELGDQHGVAMVLGNLGHLALHSGDVGGARSRYEESLALRRELGDRHGEAGSLANMAELARAEGDPAAARALLEEALDTARQLGDRYRTASLLVRMARVANELDDHASAVRLAHDGLAAAGDPPPQTTLVEALEALAAARGGLGDWEMAASLLGMAGASRDALGAPLLTRDRPPIDELRSAARDILGVPRFEEILATGSEMDVEELVALCRGDY